MIKRILLTLCLTFSFISPLALADSSNNNNANNLNNTLEQSLAAGANAIVNEALGVTDDKNTAGNSKKCPYGQEKKGNCFCPPGQAKKGNC